MASMTKSVFAALAAVLLFASGTHSAIITNILPQRGSLEGGTWVSIEGSGFERGGLQGSTIVYIGNLRCDIEEYYSHDNLLVCKTRATTVAGTFSVIVTTVDIQRSQNAKCDASCTFTYTDESTPYVAMMERAASAGEMLTFAGWLRGYKGSDYDVDVNGQRCILRSETDQVVINRRWEYGTTGCTVPNLPAGNYNLTLRTDHSADANGNGVSWGFGYSRFMWDTWRAKNNTKFHFTIFPRVDGVSHSASGSNGGDVLTVTGTGFETSNCAANQVFLESVPCQVTECTDTELKCVIGAARAQAISIDSLPTPRGLAMKVWLGTDYISESSLINLFRANNPNIRTTQTVWGMGHNIRDTLEFYAQELTGFFVPPQSTNYTFYYSCDDWGTVELSNTSSPANLAQIARVPSYTPDFWTVPSQQISRPIYLEKGAKYYMRLRMREWQVGDYLRLAVRVESPENQTPLEATHHTVRERQIFQISTSVRREVHRIRFTGVASGNFIASYAGRFTNTIAFNNAGAFSNEVKNIVTGCSSINTAISRVDNVTIDYTITFNCPTYTGYTFISIHQTAAASLVAMNSTSISIQTTKVTTASRPASGTYTLGFNGIPTNPISFDASAAVIERELEALAEIGDVTVWTGGSAMDGLRAVIEFVTPSGNLPLLTSDTASLEGENITIIHSVQQEGSLDGFYDPVAMDWFQRPNGNAPSVSVVVNDIMASCGDESENMTACAFKYSSAITPTIDAISAAPVLFADDTIEIFGTGFESDDDASAFIGSVPCPIVFSNETYILCNVTHNSEGSHVVKVVVQGRGIASSSAGPVTYGFQIDSISPLTGSVRGGNTLTVAGTGFANVVSNNTITVGGRACVVLAASYSEVTCTVPVAIDNIQSVASNSSGTYEATVVFNSHVSADDYVYDWALTPIVTGVDPLAFSSAITTIVTIAGEFTDAADISDLCPGFPEPVHVTIGSRACVHASISMDSQFISCTLLRSEPAALFDQVVQVPTVRICTSSAGIVVAHTEPAVVADVALRVTSTSPSTGSIGGGTTLTIVGAGFPTGPISKISNFLSVRIEDLSHVHKTVDCKLISATFTQIKCVTNDAIDGGAYNGSVVVRVNDFSAVCDDGNDACSYSFTEADTPAISETSPDIGGYGTLLEIVGERFLAAPSVLFNGKYACDVSSFNDTHIYCTVPDLVAGQYQITIHVAPFGFAVGSATFTVDAVLLAISPNAGSTRGGTVVTATGFGFSSVPLDNVVIVRNRRALVISSSTSEVTFVMPTHDSETPSTPVTVPFIITVVNRESFARSLNASTAQCNDTAACSFNYTTSITPLCNSISPTSGFRGVQLTVSGSGFGTNSSNVRVTIGGESCDVNTTAPFLNTQFRCIVGNVPAGAHSVFITVGNIGVARSLRTFTSLQEISDVQPRTASFGGNDRITVTGRGFGASAVGSVAQVCDQWCTVTASSYDTLSCVTAPLNTPESIATFDNVRDAVLVGTAMGTSNSRLAFDDNYETYPSSPFSDRNNCVVQLDLGATSLGSVSRIRYHPRLKNVFRTNFAFFEASADGTMWTTLASTGRTRHEGWTSIDLDTPSDFVRFLRYRGSTESYCQVAEIQFIGKRASKPFDVVGSGCNVTVGVVPPVSHPSLGILMNASSTPTPAAPVTALPTQRSTSLQLVAFQIAQTMEVLSVSPRYGSSLGGTEVTVTGTRFPSVAASELEVYLNNILCTVTEVVSDTEIKCITGNRNGALNAPSLRVIRKSNQGASVSREGVAFRYLDRWSERNTWANDEPPVEGDTVIIPNNQNVLLDVSPPKIFFLLIQGELVFDRKDLTLDAHYIFIKGGRMEIGSEEEPFLNRAVITLHGDRFSSIGVPRIGMKCLVVSDDSFTSLSGGNGALTRSYDQMGVLEIHGEPRQHVWTRLSTDSYKGTNAINVVLPVDYRKGEKIVLTSHRTMRETEELTVESISSDGLTIYTQEELQFDHLSRVETFDGIEVDMRVEVGILSRNVVIQGDETSEAQMFGSHMMVAHSGMAHIENAEFRHCGQAGLLGRYCSHWHMTGNKEGSYFRSNSYHHSFQRAVTVHAAHRVRVENNVAYHVHGHTYFVEDGNEQNNVFENNLGVFTLRLMTMLKGDAQPATFWTSSPKNVWINNVAAGSDAHGYWFELPGNPDGPSYTPTICPSREHLVEFHSNIAHGNGVHGLRIYPAWHPREDPCNDASAPAPQYLSNFTSFRNGANGIFGKSNGDLHHVNAKLVANGGEEFFLIKLEQVVYREGDPHIKDCLFVADPNPNVKVGPVGIFMPQNEFFHVDGATFINYQDTGAISGCNECALDFEMKQDGFTFRLANLKFINTRRRVKWVKPFKQIFYDLDGSLTGFVNGTATPYNAFNVWPGKCDAKDDIYDNGIVCDNTVRVRRLQIDGVDPREMDYKFIGLRPDNGLKGTIGFLPKEISGWVVPTVVNRHYNVTFETIIDFRTIRIRYSEPSYIDNNIFSEFLQLTFNHIDYRWGYEVTYAGSRQIVPMLTEIDNLAPTDPYGTSKMFYDRKWWSVMLSTLGAANDTYQISAKALQCAPKACDFLVGEEPLGIPMMWTNVTNWCRVGSRATYGLWSTARPCTGTRTLPLTGDAISIGSGMYVVMNVNPPRLTSVEIIGKLQFEDTADRVLEADTILLWGALTIGSPARPFVNKAEIVLNGVRDSPTLIVDNDLFLGNKVMAVFGELSIHGKKSTRPFTRLQTTANPGSSTLVLKESVDWVAGDTIVISSTEYDASQTETATIATVSLDGQTVTLTQPLSFRHFGGAVDDGKGGEIELRAVVAQLNHNVVFRGNDNDGRNYGAHIVFAEKALEKGVKIGRSHISGTEFRFCGKEAMEHGCMLFKYSRSYTADTAPQNLFEYNTMAFSLNYGIVSEGSVGLSVQNSIFHRTVRSAIDYDSRSRLGVFLNNAVIGNFRSPDETTIWLRPQAGFYLAGPVASVKGNVVAGGVDSGFTFLPDTCTATSLVFSDNEAHGVLIGFFLMTSSASNCYMLKNVKVWKAAHIGILQVDGLSNLRIENAVVSDSHIGISLNFVRGSSDSRSDIVSSFIFGSTAASTCSQSTTCRAMDQADVFGLTCRSVLGTGYRRVGLITPQYTNRAKTCVIDGTKPVCRPPTEPERLCGLPWEKRFGLPSTDYAQMVVTDTVFGFFNKTDCSQESRAIMHNPSQPEYTPFMSFGGVVWQNVPLDSRVWFSKTARTTDMCDDGCDALNYIVAQDRDGSFSGVSGGGVVTGDQNPAIAADTSKCTYDPLWGASKCRNTKIRAAVMENIDRDRGSRFIGPIIAYKTNAAEPDYLYSQGPGSDMCAKRFFFGQYPYALEPGFEYRVNTSGQLPNNAVFHFFSNDPNEVVLMKLFVQKDSFEMRVYIDGVLQPKSNVIPNMTMARGTNAFDGRNNFYLVMRGSSKLSEQSYEVRVTNIVQLNLTLSMTTTEFFGPRLVQNLAILLDIPESRIKIVQVHEVAPGGGIVGGNSNRRRDTTPAASNGITVQIQIEDEVTDVATQAQADQQLDRFEELIETVKTVATSGALKSSLAAAGMPVASLVVQPPAGFGADVSAFSVSVDPSTDDGNTGSSSSNNIIFGAAIGAGVGCLCALVIVAVVVVKRQKSGRPSSGNRVNSEVSIKGTRDSNGNVEAGLGDMIDDERARTDTMSTTMSSPSKRNTLVGIPPPPVSTGAGKPSIHDTHLIPAATIVKKKPSVFGRMLGRQGSMKAELSPVGSREASDVKLEDVNVSFDDSMKRRGQPPEYVKPPVASPSSERRKKNELELLVLPSLQTRMQALQAMSHAQVVRKDWEYIVNHDFYHPRLSKEKADSLVRTTAEGNFVVYGRTSVFICVSNGVGKEPRHDAIVRNEEGLLMLSVEGRKPKQTAGEDDEAGEPTFEDLTSLVQHYQTPQQDIPFVLSKENVVHMTKSSPTQRRSFLDRYNLKATNGKKIEEPELNEADLFLLDRRVSKRTKAATEEFKPTVLREHDL